MESLFYLDVRIKSEHDVLLLGGGGTFLLGVFYHKRI